MDARREPGDRDLALIAVGGYGRGELHPASDIDVLMLVPKTDSTAWQQGLEKFLTASGTWDSRSATACARSTIASARASRTSATAPTLFEARLLAGPERLFAAMRRALAPDSLWSSADFFEAKVKEQPARHERYLDTAYNLEPNVKSSPGGLRDIQTIGWVAKRHFGTDTLDELVAHGFLTREELRKLEDAPDLPVESPIRAARSNRPARGSAAVRPSDEARRAVRLRGRDVHARGRTVHAALLPHGHGREPAERDAAAAVSRGHPDEERSAGADQRALSDPQRISGSDERRGLRAQSRARCSSCSRSWNSIPRCAACAPRPSGWSAALSG